MKKIVYLVPHCHWDREWYFSSDTADVLFHSNMKDLIKYVDKQKMFLDGQWSLLDDYLKDNKEDESKVKELLVKGNISSGPFYSQPDVFNSQGETILRNIEIGELEAKRFGIENNKTAYLPDTFGFSKNFPNLVTHKGLSNFVFWRGIPKDVVEKSVINEWSTKHSKIKTLCLKNGYYTLGMYYPYNGARGLYPEKWDPKLFASKVYKRIAEQKGFEDTYIFPLGGDQAPFIENQDEFVSLVQKEMPDCELKLIENYEKFFEKTKEQVVPKYEGALDVAYTGKIHKSITSSRYEIKKLFRDAEDKLYYQLEPLEVLYKTIDLDYDFEKYKNERILKPLFIAQTHDSLGGCNTDSTNQFQITRLKRIHENIDSQIDLIIKKIMQEENLFKDELFLFNPNPNKTSVFKRMFIYSKDIEQVNIHQDDLFIKTISSKNISLVKKTLYKMEVVVFANDLEGMSYKWFNDENQKDINSEVNDSINNVELGKLKLDFVASIEKGDSYDSSPGPKINLKQSHKLLHKYTIGDDINWKQIESTLEIDGTKQSFIWDLLDNNSEIEILGFTDNKFKNTKLSLNISGFKTSEVQTSQNLGIVNVIEKDIDKNWKDDLHEYPVNMGVTDGMIIKGEHKIMTFGNNEFYNEDDSILITLFRSYNFVTNKDLEWRPSTSGLSWYEDAPDSQLQQRLDFRFVISKNKDSNKLFNKYKFKPYIYRNQQRNFIANKMTKFVINNIFNKGEGKLEIKSTNNAAISSMKLEGKDIKVRLHNLNENEVSEVMTINGQEQKVQIKQNQIKQITFKGVNNE